MVAPIATVGKLYVILPGRKVIIQRIGRITALHEGPFAAPSNLMGHFYLMFLFTMAIKLLIYFLSTSIKLST